MPRISLTVPTSQNKKQQERPRKSLSKPSTKDRTKQDAKPFLYLLFFLKQAARSNARSALRVRKFLLECRKNYIYVQYIYTLLHIYLVPGTYYIGSIYSKTFNAPPPRSSKNHARPRWPWYFRSHFKRTTACYLGDPAEQGHELTTIADAQREGVGPILESLELVPHLCKKKTYIHTHTNGAVSSAKRYKGLPESYYTYSYVVGGEK